MDSRLDGSSLVALEAGPGTRGGIMEPRPLWIEFWQCSEDGSSAFRSLADASPKAMTETSMSPIQGQVSREFSS